MSDKKHNGWTNYETWAVNLWLTNDYGTDRYWNDAAEELLRDARIRREDDPIDSASYELANRLKDEANEGMPELTGFYADLLNAALSEVNWDEIARHFVDGAVESIGDEPTEDDDTEDDETANGSAQPE